MRKISFSKACILLACTLFMCSCDRSDASVEHVAGINNTEKVREDTKTDDENSNFPVPTISREKTSDGYDIFVRPDTRAFDIWYDSVGDRVEIGDDFYDNYGRIVDISVITNWGEGSRFVERRKTLEVPCTVGELKDMGFSVEMDLETMTSGEWGIDLSSGGLDVNLEIDCKVNNYKGGTYEPLGEDKLGNCIVTSVVSKRGASDNVIFWGGLTGGTTIEEAMVILNAKSEPELRDVCLTRYPNEYMKDGIYYIKNENGAGVYRLLYAYNFDGDMARLLDHANEVTTRQNEGETAKDHSGYTKEYESQPEVSEPIASSAVEMLETEGSMAESSERGPVQAEESMGNSEAPIVFTEEGKVDFGLKIKSNRVIIGDVTLGELKNQLNTTGYSTYRMSEGLYTTYFASTDGAYVIYDSVSVDSRGETDDAIVIGISIKYDENYRKYKVAGFDKAETSEKDIIESMGKPTSISKDEVDGSISYLWIQGEGYIRINTLNDRIQHIFMMYGRYV